MDIVRIAFFIGVLLFFFPVSYALQEPLAESSAYEPRTQSSLVNSLSGLLKTILDLTDSIRTFISLVPVMISATMNALSRLAAGELEYRDVAWCFDIIVVLARELGLSQTYSAFVKAVMALTTGSLTVDDVYEILRVLPPLMRELPGAIARWLSIAYNLGFEVIFAPIAGGIIGSVIGGIIGGIIFICIWFGIMFISFLAPLVIVGIIAIAVIFIFIATFLVIDFFLFLFIIGIIIGFILVTGFLGLIMGLLFFLFTGGTSLILIPIGLVVGLLIGLFIGFIIFGLAVLFEIFLFISLMVIIVLFLIGAALCGIVLAIVISVPAAILGSIIGLIAFFTITLFFTILFTIGYPLMRWASLTGAL